MGGYEASGTWQGPDEIFTAAGEPTAVFGYIADCGAAVAPLIEFSSRSSTPVPVVSVCKARSVSITCQTSRSSARRLRANDGGNMDPNEILKAEQLLGHQFNDRALLKRALTHASLADSRLESNERLEFLGDAVLGLVVCEHLFEMYDDLLEGEMTKIKSTVVSRRVCAKIAGQLGLDELLRLGKGMSNRAALPGSVVAAVYEALIGALYVDGGMEVAKKFILSSLVPWIERAAASGHQSNFKSVLQQAAQQHMQQTPQYLVLDEKGPDHAKCFEVCVEIGARRFASSWGASKKEAEQEAALLALLELGFAGRAESGEIRVRYLGDDLNNADV